MDHAPSPPQPYSPAADHAHDDPLWTVFREAEPAPGGRGGADRPWAEDYAEVE